MLVYRARDISEEIGRDHPWTHSVQNPEWRYYDFRLQPELIPLVLEDFKELSNQPAVQRFYRLLEWMNGPNSCLESSDCGLLIPEDNPDIQFSNRRRILARLMVLFRREDINHHEKYSNWLLGCFAFHVNRNEPTFTLGAVELARFPTFFVRQNAYGYILQMKFFAYGDTDGEAMGNLGRLFAGTHTAALEVNRQVRESNLCPVKLGDSQAKT
ncbi:MAG: hypothetical protein WA871_10345 [Candidatus Acidiferrales bacterium]